MLPYTKIAKEAWLLARKTALEMVDAGSDIDEANRHLARVAKSALAIDDMYIAKQAMAAGPGAMFIYEFLSELAA